MGKVMHYKAEGSFTYIVYRPTFHISLKVGWKPIKKRWKELKAAKRTYDEWREDLYGPFDPWFYKD